MFKIIKTIAMAAGLISVFSLQSTAYAKTAVAYFSAAVNVIDPSYGVDGITGSSMLLPGDVGIVAENIASRVQADKIAIKVVDLYEKNYDAVVNRGGIEKRDQTHVALADAYDLGGYDVIYLGYPNWWSDVPRAIVTFIEQNKAQLEGKTIVPFVSHGGGGEALTTNTIKKLLPSTTHVLEPYVVYYKNVNDIQELEQWLDQVKVQLQSSNN